MNYFERLKDERKELSQRIQTLSTFIHLDPKYKLLHDNHKRLLCLQLEFMQAYLLILDLRIADIENDS